MSSPFHDVEGHGYTWICEFWEPKQDYSYTKPNISIERGEFLQFQDYHDEPPYWEPIHFEQIVVYPIMKCWGRGLKR